MMAYWGQRCNNSVNNLATERMSNKVSLSNSLIRSSTVCHILRTKTCSSVRYTCLYYDKNAAVMHSVLVIIRNTEGEKLFRCLLKEVQQDWDRPTGIGEERRPLSAAVESRCRCVLVVLSCWLLGDDVSSNSELPACDSC